MVRAGCRNGCLGGERLRRLRGLPFSFPYQSQLERVACERPRLSPKVLIVSPGGGGALLEPVDFLCSATIFASLAAVWITFFVEGATGLGLIEAFLVPAGLLVGDMVDALNGASASLNR